MTKIEVPYGSGVQTAVIPDGIPVQIVDPECPPVNNTVEELIEQALDAPIGSPRLEDMITAQNTAVIVVNDQTRPGPNAQMVAALLKRLYKAGLKDEQITIVIATGTHRAPTPSELDSLVGADVAGRITVISHDCRKNNVYLGTTKGGLPVYIDIVVADADFIITTGLVGPHKAAGFSGGRKSIVPGVSGIETLKVHHSLPIRPYEPSMGIMEENPFHLAALEAAKYVNVKFILNAVQDPHKQNVAVVAGDLEQAHAEGVRICREKNTVECRSRGDVIIASPGGAPRDCNLYQGQKALAAAEVFARQDGDACLILVAEAADGIGPELFQQWLIEMPTPDSIIERFREEGFSEGTQKAFEYARAQKKGRVIIVSDKVDPAQIARMKMTCVPTLQQAVDLACADKTPEQVMVLPKAVSIIPRFV